MKTMTLLQLRNRIYAEFSLYFRYSRKCNCLFGSFAVVPQDLRRFVDHYRFKFFRFADGAIFIEYND